TWEHGYSSLRGSRRSSSASRATPAATRAPARQSARSRSTRRSWRRSSLTRSARRRRRFSTTPTTNRIHFPTTMATEVKIPALGESITSGIIAAWHAKDGDYVEKDQVIYELETDKITSEGTAEVAGKLSHKAAEGD